LAIKRHPEVTPSRHEELIPNAGRGASAQVDATRSCRVLVRMTKDDAKGADIEEEERRKYFKLGKGDKASMVPYREKAEWYQFDGVDLGNARDGRKSDDVGVVKAWAYPELTDDVPPAALARFQGFLAAASYKESSQAENWAGHAAVDACGWTREAPGVRSAVKAWLKRLRKEGYIQIEMRKDDRRKMTPHYVPGKPAPAA